jgi:tetratricopeptide (TPR) repeat protein
MQTAIDKVLCVRCGAESGGSGQSNCTSCGVLLSRLKPGAVFYQRRFRIERLLRGDRLVLVWLVNDQQTGQRCVLLEYPGSKPDDIATIREFVKLANHLKKLRAVLVAPLFPFTFEDRFYLVEAYEERPSLSSLLARSGAISEKQVGDVFFKLLDALEHLHSQTPALFHGNPTLENVLLAGDGSVLLSDLWCPAARVSGLEADAAVEADLRGSGVIAAQLLCRSTERSPEPPPGWEQKIRTVEDPALGACIEWVLGAGRTRPGTAAELKGLCQLVRSAREAELSGRIADAIARYDEAYNRSGVPRIRMALDCLKQGAASRTTELASLPRAAADSVAPPGVAPAAPLQAPEPESPPPLVAGAAVSLLKRCPTCGSVFDMDRVFCEHDGTRLVEVRGPLPGDLVASLAEKEKPRAAAKLASEPLRAHEVVARRYRKGIGLAGAIAAAMGLAVYIFSNSLERDFDSALRSGNLVSPMGRSAYAVYLKALQKEGSTSRTVRDMNRKVQPLLDEWSRRVFQSWYRTSDIGKTTWEDIARVEDWRNRINSTPETRANFEYAMGMVAFVGRNFPQALRRFTTALQHRPGWALALNAIGRCYFNMKEFPKAEQYYRRATEVDSSWPFPVFNLANLYRDVFRNDELAERYYRKAIALDPSRPSFHYALATLYYRRGKSHWPQACEEYRASLRDSSAGALSPAEVNTARQRIGQLCQ